MQDLQSILAKHTDHSKILKWIVKRAAYTWAETIWSIIPRNPWVQWLQSIGCIDCCLFQLQWMNYFVEKLAWLWYIKVVSNTVDCVFCIIPKSLILHLWIPIHCPLMMLSCLPNHFVTQHHLCCWELEWRKIVCKSLVVMLLNRYLIHHRVDWMRLRLK